MEEFRPQGRGVRPVYSFVRRGKIGLMVALVIVLIGLPIIWTKVKSDYTVEAVFQVWPNFQRTQTGDKDLELQSDSQYRQFVNHLSRSIVRDDILNQALDKLDRDKVKACLPAETRRRCVDRYKHTLLILPIPDTYMMRVGLVSPEKKDLERIVNAVMQVFLKTTQDEQIFGSEDRIKELMARRKLLDGEVAQLEKQRLPYASKLGLTTFNDATVNPFDTILMQAREKLVQASLERSQAESALNAYLAVHESPMATSRSVQELVQTDNGLAALRNEVVKRSEDLTKTMVGLEPQHPIYQEAQAERAQLQDRLHQRETASKEAAESNIKARLTGSFMQTQRVEKELQQHVQEIEGQATEFAALFREAMRITAQIHKREQELNDVRDRINFLNSESHAIGWVRIVTWALPPDIPQGMGRGRLILILLVVAMVLALLLPIVLEMLDARVMVVGDAERAMGIPSAAWIVKEEDAAARALAREQRRRLASALLRNGGVGNRVIFGFTAANISTNVHNLLYELAYTLGRLGKSVLIVDGVTSRYDSPYASTGLGLHDVLAGQATAQQVVYQEPYANRSVNVVPLGSQKGRPIQRLDLLKVALDAWSSQFDMVLIEIPPLMVNSDSELLIDMVGQILLVVEVEVVTKGEVVQARKQIQKLAPASVGLIVTELPVDTAGDNVKRQIVETVSGKDFKLFSTTSFLALRIELWKLALVQWWSRRRRKR